LAAIVVIFVVILVHVGYSSSNRLRAF